MTAKSKSYDGFTKDERAAMKERAKELKAAQANAEHGRPVNVRDGKAIGTGKADAPRTMAGGTAARVPDGKAARKPGGKVAMKMSRNPAVNGTNEWVGSASADVA